MKILIAILVLTVSAFSQELLRPSADLDAGNLTAIGCLGQDVGSNSMPLAYDGAGLSTNSAMTATGSGTTTVLKTRLFYNWQNTNNVYASLTLNVNWSETVNANNAPGACVAYSTNGGSTYTSLECEPQGVSQHTATVTLSPTQALTSLRVGVCAYGPAGNGKFLPGSATINVFDIWTIGNYSGPPSGPGSSAGQAQRGAIIVN